MMITVTPTTPLLLQTIIMIMMLRMVIRAKRGSHIWIYFFSKVTKACRHEQAHLVSNIILWNVSYCDAILYQMWHSYSTYCQPVRDIGCKLLWGCSLDMVYYCSKNVPRVPAGHYITWNRTDGFLQPVQYVELTTLTSDVITAKEMREQTKKQSPQTVITSHFGGCRKQRDWIERKYQILYNNGSQMLV